MWCDILKRRALVSACLLLAVLACDRDATENQEATRTARALTTTHTKAWLILKAKPDLEPSRRLQPHLRGPWVNDTLKTFAETTQRGLRTRLRTRNIPHRSFWIANAVLVDADAATLESLRADPDVEQIVPDRMLPPPKATPVTAKAALEAATSGGAGTAWGVTDIAAPSVWSSYGTRGEGIVIASIDTGVELTHPALVGQYRGRNPDGTFSHDYNWFDPTLTCSSPGPCDDLGHGTHTMGTMVGADDGTGNNQIGVAPGAKWIAVRACSPAGCLLSNLLAAGQWILAPTDQQGGAPRTDLRPNIVNNSWDLSAGDDPFYQATIQAWTAAGIFPVFAAGNYGGLCGSVSSPADYPESFAVGAYDATRVIAPDSGRGASAFGPVKPDLAAPGVAIRSAFPGSSYAVYSGTSMAAPHVAGTVALMWSAAPSLVGDLTTTRTLLAESAIDVSDLSCGGTASSNDVWGGGRLDALDAVSFAVGCRPGPLKACGLRIVPSLTEGGTGLQGTVFLNGPAPAGGASVALATNNGLLVTAPTSVLVPAGAQTAVFSLATFRSSAETAVQVQATYPSGAVAATASVQLLASPTVTALAFQPVSVIGGTPATLTVTLSGPAPEGGASVVLSSGESDIAAVPGTIAVPAGQSTGSVTITPFAFTTLQNKLLTVTAAYHNTLQTASLSVSRTVPTGNAVFDAALAVPKCQGTVALCDTGGLVEGRADMLGGAEPHQPNTLLGQCADGTLGSFHSDESIDRLVLSPVGAAQLAPGGTASLDVTVWCFDPAIDGLQVFVADDARAPVWRLVSTLAAAASGAQTVTVPVTIPATTKPVFRAQWGTDGAQAGVCGTGLFTDQDDLLLAFDETPQTTPLAIAGISVPSGVVGATSSATFVVSGGQPPYAVQAALDGAIVGTATVSTTGNQVTFPLSLADGRHDLSASVTDGLGQTSSSATISFTADATGPTVTMTSPSDGQTVGSAFAVSAQATDASGVAAVALRVNGVVQGTLSAPPFVFQVDAASVAPPIVLTLVATDTLGNQTTSAPVRVVPDRSPPVVDLISPIAGTVLTGVTTMRAKASDDSGLGQVSFFVDSRLVGTDGTSPYTVALKTDTLWPGHHLLVASARDQAGNRSDSAPVDVVVERPKTVFFDDFSDGDLKGWTVQTGKWTVQRSNDVPPRALFSASTSSASTISTTQLKLTDTIVDTAVTLVGWPSKATLVVATHYQDRDNYDYLALKGDGHLQLGRRLRGVATTLVTVPVALVPGDTLHLELRAEGCVLGARVNGANIATARTDGRVVLKGAVMLSIQGGAAAFDDVAIAPIAPAGG